jgi:hypothetical protein
MMRSISNNLSKAFVSSTITCTQLTAEALEEMHYKVLLHPGYTPDLTPSDIHLFGSLREVLGRNFRAHDKVRLSVQQWLEEQPHNFF